MKESFSPAIREALSEAGYYDEWCREIDLSGRRRIVRRADQECIGKMNLSEVMEFLRNTQAIPLNRGTSPIISYLAA